VTPEKQAAATGRDDFVTYDELRGPDLDAGRWGPARLPLPTGGDHLPLDPNAELAVAEGEVRVTIPRFSLSHDTFQLYHVVETPYEDFDDDFTRLRVCEITLDRSSSTAAWRVDGRPLYETHGTFIPERVRVGFGIWTMLAIRGGRSRSLDGQGLEARWRRFRVRGIDS
jgi:Family of unknown function (DUF6081)